jgi:hypothetical protein
LIFDIEAELRGTQVARSPNSSDLPDEDIAQSNNYDLYRFGNAQRAAPVRPGQDYDVNGRGNIDPQNPLSGSYKGASAYRNPYTVGLTGVVWRTSVQNALGANGLSVIEERRKARKRFPCWPPHNLPNS